jgi:predicted nucleic acid-binding protein
VNLVIDASVLIKFYIPENLSDQAQGILDSVKQGEMTLFAPDLVYSEAGNILWKKHHLKELTRSEVEKISDALILLPLRIESSKGLLPLAVQIGVAYGITVYDAMYVALSRIYETRMITADKRLFERLAKTNLKKYVAWLGSAEW